MDFGIIQVGAEGDGAGELQDRLYVVLENSELTIKGQNTNADWVNAVYGREGLAKIGGTLGFLPNKQKPYESADYHFEQIDRSLAVGPPQVVPR